MQIVEKYGIYAFYLAVLMLSGCARGCERMEKQYQFGDRQYEIEQYSGGKLIRIHKFKGILNDSEGSDGFYYTKGDSLIEVSGDLIIKSAD